jgi:glycerol-3-phosphate acyltransferase PlsY
MPWLIVLPGYFPGAIPTAYIAGCLKGKDIRQAGNGNGGAANAFRQLGAKTGITGFIKRRQLAHISEVRSA